MNKIVTLGKFGAPHGIQGWIRLQSFTEPAKNICNYQDWLLKKIDNNWQPLEITQIKSHGSGFIAKVATIDTPEQARFLTNRLIGIAENALPKLPENEYYWSQLVGLTVVNQAGILLGVVDHLFETGSNDVLVIKNGSKEYLLPYLKPYIESIDLQKQKMLVKWDID